MTITVNTPVTNAASAASSMPGGAAPGAAGSGAASDLFASLLGIQMSAMGSTLPGISDQGDAKPVSDKPTAKGESDDSDVPTAAAMPLLAALQASLQAQPQPVDPKTPTQDLLAQQAASKPDLTALLQAKPTFNWQNNQQKLPAADTDAAQFLPLQQLQPQPLTQNVQAQANANMPVLTLPQTLNDPAWGKALGEQMLTMVNMKADKAQIQLNPPQMGPIEITLKMNGNDQAQVLFTAAVPATREALENNMHQLRSMMSSSGIQLTDSQVSSGQSGQQQQAYQQKKGRSEPAVGEVEGVDALSAIKAARGILSIFA